jgi:hypothetical protein
MQEKKTQTWKLFCQGDRIQVIEQVKSAILTNNGSILHHEMFSDLGMSLTIQVVEEHLPALHAELEDLGEIHPPEARYAASSRGAEWTIFMNVSFASGTGDMEHDIPAVER